MRGRAGVLMLAGTFALTACGGDGDSASDSAPTPSPTPTVEVDNSFTGEEVIYDRLYFNVTGHTFTEVTPGRNQKLGPCTGKTTLAEVVAERFSSSIETKLLGDEVGLKVIEQLAQTYAAGEAMAVADEIVELVDTCAAISGGDFGYGDPVTVVAEAERKIVYFPAFDSDRKFGGYAVFAVGSRVGVLEVVDAIDGDQVAKLAKEVADIAAKLYAPQGA